MSRLERKTKAELIELIDQQAAEIQRLNKELEQVEINKRYEDITDDIRDVYDKLVKKGFEEFEALNLVHNLTNNGLIPSRAIRRVSYQGYLGCR